MSNLDINAINGSLWTLKNEVVFYAIVPFIFMLYKKWGYYFLVILYSLSAAYMFVIDYIASLGIVSRHHADILLFQFPAQVRLFVVGILLYLLFDKFNNKNIYIFILTSIFFIIFFKNNSYFNYIFYPFCIGIFMLYSVYFIKQIKINFDFSYSFYILHFPVIQLSLFFGVNPSNPILSFAILFIVILVLSYFSEKYIEKKFIRIGKNIIRQDKNA